MALGEKTIVIDLNEIARSLLTEDQKAALITRGIVKCHVCGRKHDLSKDNWRRCARKVVTPWGELNTLRGVVEVIKVPTIALLYFRDYGTFRYYIRPSKIDPVLAIVVDPEKVKEEYYRRREKEEN